MISKETFINTMAWLKDFEDKCDSVDKALSALSPDFSGFFLPDVSETIIKIFADIFNDKDEWLSYLAFEKNYLQSFEYGDILDKDNNPIDLSCWGNVYDFLVENMNGISED